MTCTKCNTDCVKNSALNKEFWYCRQCKEEVLEFIDLKYDVNHATDWAKAINDAWLYT